MTITTATEKVLNDMFPYQQFSGLELRNMVEYHTGGKPYVATCLRLMRYWRRDGYNVKCLNRQKSLYVIVED